MSVYIPIRAKANTKIVRKGLQDLSAEIPKIGRQQIYKTLTTARSRLKRKVAKPTYPIPWDNPRQKVKVIIMLKLAGNLPYRRSGDYVQGFQVVRVEGGYDLINSTAKAVYIGGDADGQGQSRIFRGRYPLIRSVVDEEVGKLPSEVVANLDIAVKQKGFESGRS